VKAATAGKADVKSYLYDIWARFDHGFQITDWTMAAEIGLADMPSCKFASSLPLLGGLSIHALTGLTGV